MADGSEETYLQEKTDEVIGLTGEYAYSWNGPCGFHLLWIKACRNKQADASDGDNDKTTAAVRQPHTSYSKQQHGNGIDFPC